MSIHLIASESLIFPRKTWGVFKSRCLKITFDTISRGIPFLLAYEAEYLLKSCGETCTFSFAPSFLIRDLAVE
jgi:hypothetical protein